MDLGKLELWWQIPIGIWANQNFDGKYQLGFGQIGFLVAPALRFQRGSSWLLVCNNGMLII